MTGQSTTRTTTTQPPVSMVMATNRVSPYLGEAIESVLGQSYGDLEVIVVDDGCPEPEVLTSVLGRYPVRVFRQEPLGVSAAFNRGVFHAGGELIGFFGDDDRYPSGWVSAHVARHVRDPALVLTYAHARSIDAAGSVFEDRHLRQADRTDVYAREVTIFGGGFVARREALICAGGFNPLVRYAEDLDLVLRLSYLGPFAYVPDTYFDYRTHTTNSTRRYRELATSIRAINRSHRTFLATGGDVDLDRAIRSSERRNDRYAGWRSVRSARAHVRAGQPLRAAADLAWGLHFAPLGPLSAPVRRLGRRAR